VPGRATARGAAVPARSAVPGRLLVRPNGGARIGVRCPPGRAPCAGKLWIEGATFADGLLVNGLPADDVLAPLALRFSLRAGRDATRASASRGPSCSGRRRCAPCACGSRSRRPTRRSRSRRATS
jgi:hypothetical protein